VLCWFIRLARTSYVGGSVLVPGRGSSIVEVTRFQFERFTVNIKELAEWRSIFRRYCVISSSVSSKLLDCHLC